MVSTDADEKPTKIKQVGTKKEVIPDKLYRFERIIRGLILI